MPIIYYVDPDGGNDANAGTSFATRKRTINSAAAALTAGDEIRIIANTAPVNIGSCTWTQYGTVALPAGETVTLYTDGAWASPGANVTIGAPSTTIRREGVNSNLLSVAATYTGTTKMASFSGFSPVDLSTYSKINLWFYNSVGTTYANLSAFSLLLCSDSNGNTPVVTLRFPASVAPTAASWTPIVMDNGAPFGAAASTINSITLSADRQIHTATTNVHIDNVFVSKNVRLDGLISKNSTTNVDTNNPELWYAPRSVVGNVITLEQSPAVPNYTTSPARGYIGVSETADGYVLTPHAQAATSSTATATLNSIATRIGTEAAPIIIGGGWDRDTMTQQISGISWFRVTNNVQYFIAQTASRNITFNNIGVSRCQDGMRITGSSITATSGITLNNIHTAGIRGYGVVAATTSNSYILSNCSAIQCGGTVNDGGFLFSAVFNLSAINCTAANSYVHGCWLAGCPGAYFKNFKTLNNTTHGIFIQSNSCLYENISSINNGGVGMYFGSSTNSGANNEFFNSYIAYNGTGTGATNTGGMTFDIGSTNNKFYNTQVIFNSGGSGANSGGIIFAGTAISNTFFYGLTTSNNRANSLPVAFKFGQDAATTQGDVLIYNWNVNEANKATGWLGYSGTKIYSTNEGGDPNSHFVYSDNGIIQGTTLSARSPGICWQMILSGATGTGTFFRGEQYPLLHNIKRILCTANTSTTASLWVRRTNSTVTGKFVMRGYQIGGVNNDIAVYTTPSSLTDWEKLSIIFTPTQTGFVEFEMQAFTTNYYATTVPTGILIWDDFDVIPPTAFTTAAATTSGDYGFIAQGVVVSTPVSASGGSVATPTEKSFTFC